MEVSDWLLLIINSVSCKAAKESNSVKEKHLKPSSQEGQTDIAIVIDSDFMM